LQAQELGPGRLPTVLQPVGQDQPGRVVVGVFLDVFEKGTQSRVEGHARSSVASWSSAARSIQDVGGLKKTKGFKTRQPPADIRNGTDARLDSCSPESGPAGTRRDRPHQPP